MKASVPIEGTTCHALTPFERARVLVDGQTFIHSKLMIVAEELSTIGTASFTSRSMRIEHSIEHACRFDEGFVKCAAQRIGQRPGVVDIE